MAHSPPIPSDEFLDLCRIEIRKLIESMGGTFGGIEHDRVMVSRSMLDNGLIVYHLIYQVAGDIRCQMPRPNIFGTPYDEEEFPEAAEIRRAYKERMKEHQPIEICPIDL